MDLVRLSIARPVGVTVGVLLLVMFGLIGLTAIPIQLTPTVDRPILTVTTTWAGRSPQEIVDEITKEQEERLKSVSNLTSMRSTTVEGSATISLEFYVGSDIGRAMQEVNDALRQVPSYPADVEEPTVQSTDGEASNAIAWIIIDIDPAARDRHPDFDITTLYNALDKEVKPYLERIDGVAQINVYGGREREMRVLLDSRALADRSLRVQDVIGVLRAQNENISAGTIEEGKRDYRVRVIGQYENADQILETIVAYRDGRPVYVADIGTVELGYEKRRGFVRSLGTPSIAINAIRQSGANVMDVMDELKIRLEEVRSDILPNLGGEVGPDLRMRQVYDETVYIKSSIGLVTQNLWIGGVLAAIVLLIFLRSLVTTGVIALAIPVSVVGTFLVMLGFGRSLNVVSLAGLAFAVGMVVDNAIVVLENIYRHVQAGETPMNAALKGGREIWGAVLASTLTTVAVFVPILTIQEEAGQLFRDIALAVVAAVSLSLLVSVTVIPAACSRWLRKRDPERESAGGRRIRSLFGLTTVAQRTVNVLGDAVHWAITGWRGWTVRPAIIIAMTVVSLVGAWQLMPPMDYLPAGNRNLVFGGLLIPPGYSVGQQESIAERLETEIGPYMHVEDDPQAIAGLAPIPRGMGPQDPIVFDPVGLENFFIGSFGGSMFVGATSREAQVVMPVGSLLTNAMGTIPDSYGGARQSTIFGRGFSAGNSISIEISGPDLERVTSAAGMIFGLAGQEYGFGNVRADPANFNLLQQEYQVHLTRQGRELGLTTTDVGTAVRGLFDGAFVGDYEHQGDTIDLVVLPKGGRIEYKERLGQIPVTTPMGPVVPLDSVVELRPARSAQQVLRIEELPAVSVSVIASGTIPLEEMMQGIREKVIAPAEHAGMIDRTMRVRLEGTAADLDQVQAALFGKASGEPPAGWQKAGIWVSWTVLGCFMLLAAFVAFRGMSRHKPRLFYGSAGAILLGCVLAGLVAAVSMMPQLGLARFVWALVVTYLLMSALFESFTYPFVIMFSVPLAVVGGFAGLRIVHVITLRDPTISPQQLDVLTMLGFVILIGVVVNNAILIVHQALNFMRTEEVIEPHQAIAQSVRTRIRPIFMGTLTSVGGMLPLVLFPGAGSEMYRGLGSVVIGGLLMSTVFTLVLVPLVLSLMLDMSMGLRAALARRTLTGAEAAGIKEELQPV